MIPHKITVHHNNDSRFMPYQDGHRLIATLSLWRHLPAGASPEDLADWAFHVFNADLGTLEQHRTAVHGETAFLAACIYRLGLRSLSVGDVVEVATDQQHWWLACEGFGWKRISPPGNRHGQPLTAEKVYQHLHAQRPR